LLGARGDKAAWIAEAFAQLPVDFPRVRAVGWFNEATETGDWPIETSPAALAAFTAEVARPYLRGRLP